MLEMKRQRHSNQLKNKIKNSEKSQPSLKNDSVFQRKVAALEIELKALEYGDFTLASGLKSNFYFDGRLLSLDPESSNIISDWILSNAINFKANFIGGPAVAAVPLIGSAVYASHNIKSPLKGFFIRPDKKDHGLQKQIEGNFESNSSVVVIDDTISTGGSLLNSLEIVKPSPGLSSSRSINPFSGFGSPSNI